MTLLTLLFTLLLIPASLLAWSAWSLKANLDIAKQTEFPIFVRWVTPANPLWMLFGSTIVRTCRALHIGTEHFHRYYLFGWEGNERHLIHQEFGPSFMLVSPGGNWLCISDADAIHYVIKHPKDFRRNMEQMAVLNVYGKNLSTTDDEEWQKHRKVTGMTFTEKNNEIVWRESLAQSNAMRAYWMEHQPVKTIAEDTKVFTLNVLAAALFNKAYPFQGAADATEASISKDEDSYKYRESLSRILPYIIPIFVFGAKGLEAWWTPRSWKNAAEAVATFQSYVTGLINEERALNNRGDQKNQHMVAALVRACEADNASEDTKSTPDKRKSTLSEREIISNLFVYAFAGNDTTAIALSHILVFLAAHPETQDWIAEELQHYLPGSEPARWNYKMFPSLKRCLAVVMEGIRMSHPLTNLCKTTNDQARTIVTRDRTVIVPAGTAVHLSMSALHTHPQYWGDDGLEWKPQRFVSSTQPKTQSFTFEDETVAPDTSAHYLPWAYGQRICPGKKFSQVELVAALAMLFRDHKVEPLPHPGESMNDARKRAFATALEVDHEGKMLFEMKYPEKACLMWSKRPDGS